MRPTRNSFLYLAGTFGLAMAAAGFISQSPQAAEKLNKDEVRAIVKEYLAEHPELVIEAIQSYQENQQEIEERKFQETIAKRTSDLNNPNLPFIGNPDGDIVVVEFFDFNCGYCKRALGEVVKLVESDKNVKVVFHEMPILSESSNTAARYALASHKQGKYFEYHSALMKYSGGKNEESLEKIAKDLGLDVEKLRKDANSQEIKEEIGNSLTLSRDLGIRGTPAFVIGDTLAPGYMTYQNMKEVVNQVRNDKG